jgi:hypothetical protein
MAPGPQPAGMLIRLTSFRKSLIIASPPLVKRGNRSDEQKQNPVDHS